MRYSVLKSIICPVILREQTRVNGEKQVADDTRIWVEEEGKDAARPGARLSPSYQREQHQWKMHYWPCITLLDPPTEVLRTRLSISFSVVASPGVAVSTPVRRATAKTPPATKSVRIFDGWRFAWGAPTVTLAALVFATGNETRTPGTGRHRNPRTHVFRLMCEATDISVIHPFGRQLQHGNLQKFLK